MRTPFASPTTLALPGGVPEHAQGTGGTADRTAPHAPGPRIAAVAACQRSAPPGPRSSTPPMALELDISSGE